MNYLFLFIGNDSFYESILMSKIVDDLPESTGIVCITGKLQTVYFAENQRILKVDLGSDLTANKKIFFDVLKDGEILSIFIFDFHKFFFKSVQPIIQFDIKWLENLNIPVNLIDYLDIFDYNNTGQLFLKNSGKYINKKYPDNNSQEIADLLSEEELPQPDEFETQAPFEVNEDQQEDITLLDPFWPNIIKLSPPYPTQINEQSNKIFYWKSSAKTFVTDELEKMKAPLGITEGKKNVLLIFSFQLIMQSVFENKQAHYLSVIKILIIYLKRLDIEMNLFIVGFENYPNLVKNTKIKLKTFKLLNHGLYKTLTSFADLIITDTPWHPVLLDAAELKIPAGVIGNSLSLREDGTLDSEYETTDPEVFNELDISLHVAPNIFFPFIAFPLKAEEPPEFTYFEKKFLYYLLDIYHDEGVIAFLGEFLITDAEVSENLKERQEEYSERAENALDTEALFLSIQNL